MSAAGSDGAHTSIAPMKSKSFASCVTASTTVLVFPVPGGPLIRYAAQLLV